MNQPEEIKILPCQFCGKQPSITPYALNHLIQKWSELQRFVQLGWKMRYAFLMNPPLYVLDCQQGGEFTGETLRGAIAKAIEHLKTQA